MDRLDELEVFVAILDAGSLAGAARKLRRSAPAVTRALATLEQRLGARLVERTTRRLAPTEAGRRLGEQARRVLAEYAAALSEDEQAPLRGMLRVTAPMVFGARHVTPLVNIFLDAFPDMRVELLLNDHNVDLIEEGVDVAVRIGPLPDTGMVARRVGEVRRLLCASRSYLRRRGAPASPQDVAAHDVIYSSLRHSAPEWRFYENGRENVVRLEPRITANSTEAVLQALRDGRGLARPLSYQVFDDLAKGKLVRLLPASEPPPLPVHLVLPSAKHRSPKQRAFVDMAVEWFSGLEVLQPLKL